MAALFSSLGQEIKVWCAATETLLETYCQDNEVTDICWDKNGVVLAAAKRNSSICLHQFDKTKATSSHTITMPPESHSACIEYDSTSRYLANGCNDGALHIYDTFSMKAYKSHLGHRHPIKSLCWNWNDKNVALGSQNGEVFLYNIITGQASSPFKPTSSVSIECLLYNPYRKASLVSADAMGAVTLWDTNTRGHVHSFSTSHKAPASDLVFSPVNDFLMLSVGLDRQLIFYDMQNKKVIKTIVADYPLTCVDMQDAGKIAVGTSRGKILFYDIRMSNEPLSTVQAHKSSVKRIVFNKKDEVTASSMSLKPTPIESATYPSAEVDENENCNLTSDNLPTSVFSPLKDNSLANVSVLSNSNNSALNSYLNQVLGNKDDLSGRVSIGRQGAIRNSFVSSSLQGSLNESVPAPNIFSPCKEDVSNLTDSSLGVNIMESSFMNQILGAAGSRDVSTNQVASHRDELSSSSFNKRFSSGRLSSHPMDVNGATAPGGSTSLRSQSHVSPRLSSQSGIGASPSLQDVKAASQSLNQSTVSRHPAMRDVSTTSTSHDALAADVAHSSSPDRKSSSSTVKANFSSTNHSTTEDVFMSPGSVVRHKSLQAKSTPQSLESDVMEMKADIKEIKAMLLNQRSGSSAAGIGNFMITGSTGDQIPSQGDMLRQFIRNEIQEQTDRIHNECIEVIVSIHRMLWRMQNLLLRELAINPDLVEEIERLKKEIKQQKYYY